MTAVITRENFSDGSPAYVARCPELNLTSQGTTLEDAFTNLQEAIEGFLEVACAAEIVTSLARGSRAEALLAMEIKVPQLIELAMSEGQFLTE